MSINRRHLPVVICYLATAGLFVFTIRNGFFWDTLQLGSKHASFYYSTGFSDILLPDSIDSGHIPAFGMYLALIWKIFGRSLIVSHIAMIPFILGILWQLKKVIDKLIIKRYAGWAFLLVFIDPTLLSQITLVSPDVPLVFFFLLAVNSLMNNRKKLLSLSIALLFMTSMRGMMISFCLLTADIIRNISFSGSVKLTCISLFKRSLIYLPAFFIFILYSAYHFSHKEWVGFHSDSPWAELFKMVPFTGMIYNAGIIGWRLLDFGRIGIWISFLILLARYKRDFLKVGESRFLFILFMIVLVFLTANMIWAKNLLCHRYLLPVYLSFSLLCASLLFAEQTDKRLRVALSTLWVVMIITGNLWVYPEKTATGWDATLAHLPYYSIRKQAIEYLDRENIDFNKVQSFFPNNSSIDDFDLNNDHRRFVDFDNKSEYVIYSNVFNVTDDEYNTIKNGFAVELHLKRGLVFMDICRRKDASHP